MPRPISAFVSSLVLIAISSSARAELTTAQFSNQNAGAAAPRTLVPVPQWTSVATGAEIRLEIGWTARVDAVGLEVDLHSRPFPQNETKDIQLALRTVRFGRAGATSIVAAGAVQVDGRRASIERGGLREWFDVHREAIVQGWTVAERPDSAADVKPLRVDVAFEGLQPRICEGGRKAELVDEKGLRHLYYLGLRAWDASGHELEARMSPGIGTLGIEVVDTEATYPITIDPGLSALAWAFETNEAFAEPTNTITAGDVNGDGFSDVLVSSPTFGATGRVWAFYGDRDGLPFNPPTNPTPSWTTNGDGQAGCKFGRTVAPAGDVDRDGFDDVLIGAELYTNGQTEEGKAYLYRGSPSGLSATPSWTFESQRPSLRFGRVAHAGDVDGDGYDDLFIAATDQTPNGDGEFFLFRGGPSGPSVTPDWTVAGSDAGIGGPGALGVNEDDIQLSGVGDLDADGKDDIAIGLRRVFGEGRAFIFRGASPTPSTTPTQSLGPVSIGGATLFLSLFGLVAPAGDFNGDGYADLLIGAYGQDAFGDVDQGAAYLFLGQNSPTLPVSPTYAWLVGGSFHSAVLGRAIGSAGDVSGDGLADVLVGTELAQGNTSGQFIVFHGNPAAIGSTPNNFTINGTPGSELGGPHGGLYTAGDVNGDGLSDVLASAAYFSSPEFHEGRAELFEGQRIGQPSTSASASGTPGSRLGSSVALAGDVNGLASGAFSDVVVGARTYSNGQSDEGAIFQYLGSTSGLVIGTTPLFESNDAGSRLGTSVAGAVDINGDGRSDVIAGAPGHSVGLVDRGRVYVFFGSASGLSPAPVSFSGDVGAHALAKFGEAVSGAGDVNGDGFGDFLVGAPGANGIALNAGHVSLFLGGPTGPQLSSWSVDGTTLEEAVGAAVASAGDLNRDGFSDVIIGVPGFNGGQTGTGRALVYLGSSTGLSLVPVALSEPLNASARYGTSVASAGDVNNDGFADVVVGAPGQGGGGAAYLYLGSGAGSLTLVNSGAGLPTISEPQAGAQLGWSVCSAGDVDGDRFSDILIGARSFQNTLLGEGRVSLYYGRSNGIDALAGLTLFGGGSQAHLGEDVSPAGDVNGDGLSDLLLGAPDAGGVGGSVSSLLASGGTTSIRRAPQQRVITNALAVDLLGLAPVQGAAEIRLSVSSLLANGQPGTTAGRERVRMEWQIANLSTDIYLTPIFRSATILDSATLAGPLNQVVGGLSTNSVGYRWRVRAASDSPFFPHGPWTTLQGNGLLEKKIGTGYDCNSNGYVDNVELVFGITADCDSNSAPDDCDLAQGAADHNNNSILDACEPAGSVFCAGDNIDPNVTTDCPCGNFGGVGRGCSNSVNALGALLSETGIANPDFVVLRGSGMPATVTCIYLQGDAVTDEAFGDGVRCAAGSLIRLRAKTNVGGASQFPDSTDTVTVSQRGGVTPGSGAIRYYQTYYRNSAAAFCPPLTFNVTNGIVITW